MSIYKDAVMAAAAIIQNAEPDEDYRWVNTLKSKITEMGLILNEDTDLNDLNLIAQRLVSEQGVKRLSPNA